MDKAVDNITETSGTVVVPGGNRAPLPYAKLISPALMTNGLLVAGLLLYKHILFAVAVVAGCSIGLLIYAALNAVMDRTFSTLLAGSRQQFVKSPESRLTLGVLVVGKFIVVGLLMFVFFDVLHLNIGWFVTGFLITQCVVSFAVFKRMAKS